MQQASTSRPIRELAHREAGGLEVTLFWRPLRDELVVCACDQRYGAYFEIPAEPYLAFDIYYHPFFYRDFSSVDYEDARQAILDSMLKVFAGFVVSLGGLALAAFAHGGGAGVLGIPAAALAETGVVALTALEALVAFLQAFVFAVLACVYLNDVVNLGHHH